MIRLEYNRAFAEALRAEIGTMIPYGDSHLQLLFNDLDAALDKPVPADEAPKCGGCPCSDGSGCA